MYDNIKGFLEDDSRYFTVLLILVAATSFGLGKLSSGSIAPSTSQSATVSLDSSAIDGRSAATLEPNPLSENTAAYVASKNGTKYHLPSCPGAKQITDTNKIFFTTAVQAASAGYTPAANCPGL